MEQKKKEMLMGCGVDFEDAVRRFMGMRLFLKNFLGSLQRIQAFRN